MMNLRDKKIVVVGLGRTGLATARFLQQKGARVLVADLEADGVLSVRQPTAGVRGDLDILTRLIQRVSEL